MSEEIKVTTFGFGGLDKDAADNLQEFLTELTNYLNAKYHLPWQVRSSKDGTFVVTARIYGGQHE